MRFKVSLLLFCLAAIFYLGVGTYKASRLAGDFISVYSGVRCFVAGCNTYDPVQLQEQYVEAGGNAGRLHANFWEGHSPVYPPSTFVVLSPLALLPFHAGWIAWSLISGGLLVLAIGMVLWMCPRKYFGTGVLLGVVFLLAGGTSLLGEGNPATLVSALTMIGAVLFLRDRYIPLAVVLLTIALTVKPQLAGLVVLYFLVRRIHWRGAVVVLSASLVILLLGCATLQARPASRNWLPLLKAQTQVALQPGHADDPSPANVKNGDMLNLQTLTSMVFPGRMAYNAAAWVIWLGMFAGWIYAIRKMGTGGGNHLLVLPPLLVLTLLPVYHRGCDDWILLLAIPMVLMVLGRKRILGYALVAVLALPHLMDTVMPRVVKLARSHWGMPYIVQHKLLFLALMRYQSPVLLVMFGLFMAGMLAGGSGRPGTDSSAGLLDT